MYLARKEGYSRYNPGMRSTGAWVWLSALPSIEMACSVWPQSPWLEQRYGSTENSHQSPKGNVLTLGRAEVMRASVYPCLEARGTCSPTSNKDLRVLQLSKLFSKKTQNVIHADVGPSWMPSSSRYRTMRMVRNDGNLQGHQSDPLCELECGSRS